MRRERDGVRRRLGAAVRRDLQASAGRREEELERPLPLLDAEQEPFARRPQREQAVEPAPGEEVDVGAERRARRAGRRRAASRPRPEHHADMVRLYVRSTLVSAVERPVDPGVVDPRPAVERVGEHRLAHAGSRPRRRARSRSLPPSVPVRVVVAVAAVRGRPRLRRRRGRPRASPPRSRSSPPLPSSDVLAPEPADDVAARRAGQHVRPRRPGDRAPGGSARGRRAGPCNGEERDEGGGGSLDGHGSQRDRSAA